MTESTQQSGDSRHKTQSFSRRFCFNASIRALRSSFFSIKSWFCFVLESASREEEESDDSERRAFEFSIHFEVSAGSFHEALHKKTFNETTKINKLWPKSSHVSHPFESVCVWDDWIGLGWVTCDWINWERVVWGRISWGRVVRELGTSGTWRLERAVDEDSKMENGFCGSCCEGSTVAVGLIEVCSWMDAEGSEESDVFVSVSWTGIKWGGNAHFGHQCFHGPSSPSVFLSCRGVDGLLGGGWRIGWSYRRWRRGRRLKRIICILSRAQPQCCGDVRCASQANQWTWKLPRAPSSPHPPTMHTWKAKSCTHTHSRHKTPPLLPKPLMLLL